MGSWVWCPILDCRRSLSHSCFSGLIRATLVSQSTKEVLVQISPINSKDKKFVSLSALHEALCNDSDLACLESAKPAQILQTIFVYTGCDYISFCGIGCYFFQHASFITGVNAQGSLADIQLHTGNFKQGFLAFLRLVGTVYYKKYASVFDFPSPATHFLQFSAPTHLVHHRDWINDDYCR